MISGNHSETKPLSQNIISLFLYERETQIKLLHSALSSVNNNFGPSCLDKTPQLGSELARKNLQEEKMEEKRRGKMVRLPVIRIPLSSPPHSACSFLIKKLKYDFLQSTT